MGDNCPCSCIDFSLAFTVLALVGRLPFTNANWRFSLSEVIISFFIIIGAGLPIHPRGIKVIYKFYLYNKWGSPIPPSRFWHWFLGVGSDWWALASSLDGPRMAWANSHPRSIVRFDLRPFGSDTPSQPRSGVYVKEPMFAIAWITLAKIIHKSLISNLLSDSRKMSYFYYSLYGHKKRTVLNRPFSSNLKD